MPNAWRRNKRIEEAEEEMRKREKALFIAVFCLHFLERVS